MPAIVIKELRKSYGDVKAVDGIDLEIEDGEIFGILGPNGAGKTTTLEMVETLREPDSGEILVAGLDIRRDQRAIKEILGVQLQNTVFFDNLSVWETIDLFGSFYSKHLDPDPLLEMVGLEDKSKSKLDELSGGQLKRVSIALALVNDPKIVFLDEPTTGLDPQARRNIWEIVERLRGGEKTVVVTTHYIEEAEYLCDRVAVMDRGRIIALDRPAELVTRYAPESSISFRMKPPPDESVIEGLKGVMRVSAKAQGEYLVTTETPQDTLAAIFTAAYLSDAVADEITMRRATLEDVFLKLTGRSIEE